MDTNESRHIAALLERIGRLMNVESHGGGLQPVHWEVLRYLARANRFSNTPASLTAYLGLTKGTVSQSVIALEAKGLVTRKVDAADRRSIRLALTAAGRRLLADDPLADIAAAIDGLSDTARRHLGKGLSSLLANRLAARQRQPFGQCHDCRYFARHHPQGGPHRCQLVEEPLSETEADQICFEQSPRR